MLISRASIESVKERASLVDVAGEAVKLRRQGSSMVGLCPFHSERSPSFHIRDNGRFFHCFGCGASGNVISFVMQIRGVSFPDAVTELAQRFGITLELEKGSSSDIDGKKRAAASAEKEKLLKLNGLAQLWFQDRFQAANSPAQSYLIERGVGAEAVKEFCIGYAPPEFAGLHQVMLKRKVPPDLALKSGLIRRSERGDVYDTFRSRVTFPILDERKRIIGFGGRLIAAGEDSKAPKYLNSPETPLYEKSKVFYGLPHAIADLRATKEAIIVEGYFDVIGLWQAGVKRALATCGTALTEFHVKRLIHLVNRVVLLFDGDAAGIAAAGKVFPLFVNSGLDVQVVALPAGEDPDTFALRYGEQTEQQLSKLQSRPLLDCFISFLASGAGLAADQKPHELAPAAKGRVAAQIGSVLAEVKNEVERAELLERCSNILKVSVDSLLKVGVKKANSSKETLEDVDAEKSSTAPATTLPYGIDRDLLAEVMAHKGALPSMILGDGALCELLSPVTIEFIAGLEAILRDSTLSDDQRKEATKVMLRGYGTEWVQLWKSAHQQTHLREGLDLEAVLKHARLMARKQRIQALIKELEQGISASSDENEKIALAKAKVDLERQARAG